MGSIYKITNTFNQKIYIGKTRYNDVLIRFKQHILCGENLKDTDHSYLHKAIHKYGKKFFTISCLEKDIENISELNSREKYYIKLFNSTDSNIGYNLSLGGDGGNQGVIINKKISEACKGKNTWTKGRVTINNGQNEKKIYPNDLSKYLNDGWYKGRLPEIGKKCGENLKKSWENKSDSEKFEIREKQKANYKLRIDARTPEDKEKIAKKISDSRKNNPKCASARKGIPAKEWMTEEHLEHLKEAGKRPKTEEHRKKISESRLKNGSGKGEKNGMFGKGYKLSGYNSKIAKKVRCVETGVVYYSTIIASQETGIRAGGIQDAARGVQKTCAGYHWEYITDDNY